MAWPGFVVSVVVMTTESNMPAATAKERRGETLATPSPGRLNPLGRAESRLNNRSDAANAELGRERAQERRRPHPRGSG